MIHATAIVDIPDLDSSTNVWAYAHVMAGAVIGKQVNIGDHAFVEGGAKIGDNVTIKNYVCVWEGITIEDNVFVGPRATFTNDRWPRSARMPLVSQRYARLENWLEPTCVREGASIGAAATICPGVELGAYCMIAAGAVVTQNVPAFGLIAGVPARQLGWVCSCGFRLDGSWDEVTCKQCGETAASRISRVKNDSMAQ